MMDTASEMDFSDCATNAYFLGGDMAQSGCKNDCLENIGTVGAFQQRTTVAKRLPSNIGGGYNASVHVFYASVDTVDFFPKRSIYGNALRAIDGLCQSPLNYSEHTPDAPGEAQVEAAKAGLLKLATNNLPEPKIMLLDDGTLGAFWYARGNRYVSIDFEADGNLVWGVDDETGIEVGEFRVTGDIPNKILSLLKK